MKKKQPKFYQDGDRFLVTTGESLKNLPMVFLSFTGDAPGSVKEGCTSQHDLEKMVPTESANVPDEWLKAFEACGIETPRKKEEQEEELFYGHVLAGDCDVFTAAAASFTPDETPEEEQVVIGTNDIILWIALFWIFSFFVIGLLSS